MFSNTVAPSIISASLKVLDILKSSTDLRDKLEDNTKYFRDGITKAGLKVKPGVHPIVPIMLGDAVLAQNVAARMLEKNIYVIGFFYPVVPKETARIRIQISAAHSKEDLDYVIKMFKVLKLEFGL